MGRVFVATVQGAIETISNDPGRFQPIGEGVWIFRLKRFPYYLFYYHDEVSDSIIIYALAHHHRQADYWRSRLQE